MAPKIAKLKSLRASAFLRGVFAGRTMRDVGNHRGTRPISFALFAGLVAFEAVLVMGTGMVGIPGVFVIHLADASGGSGVMKGQAAHEGGESVVAKLPATTTTLEPAAEAAASPPPPATEPRLEGLADIPLDSLDRPRPKPAGTDVLAANAAGREVLPWDAVEPVPFSPNSSASAPSDATAALARPTEAASAPASPPVQLPAAATVEAWVKAKASEIKGEDRGRPLYHFEVWLDAPEDVKSRLVAVAYDFNTPAVMPQSLVSREEKTGFRVSAGGLACADKITVTLKFSDGQSQQVSVDGCRLLG